MNDDHVLIEASREVRAALMMAQADENATEGRHAVMLNIAQLRAVSVTLGLALSRRHDPPTGELKEDVTVPEEPRDVRWPHNEAQGVWMQQLIVRSAEAIPGIQALLFLRRGIKNVEVTQAGSNGPSWTLKWRDTRDVDLDFLRPHILPPKTEQPTWTKSEPGVLR